MNLHNQRTLSDNNLILNLQKAAKIYQQYVDKDVLIIYAHSKKGPFSPYQFHAGKEHFQHLAGVKSPNGAKWFYERCLDISSPLKRKEIVPKDSIKNTSSKIAVLPNALDLTQSKAYKLGNKNLITLNNSFSMALGNTQHILGFDKRNYYLPIPVTTLNRSIFEFCTQVNTIYLIMVKSVSEPQYSTIFYEITKNILHKADFDSDILNLIDKKIL